MSFKKTKTIKKSVDRSKQKRLKIIKIYKKYLESRNYKTDQNLKNNKFMEQFLKSIGLFFNKTHNLQIICKQLNKQTSYENKNLTFIKNKFIRFRKFRNADFFKDGVNFLFTAVTQKGSSQMLADFIGYRLKRMKRHKYFLSFLKKVLTTFINNKCSIVSGIKITITGRFNGAPRSRKNIILIKKMPLQTIDALIEHSQATAYTKDGTFGIKVWTYTQH